MGPGTPLRGVPGVYDENTFWFTELNILYLTPPIEGEVTYRGRITMLTIPSDITSATRMCCT